MNPIAEIVEKVKATKAALEQEMNPEARKRGREEGLKEFGEQGRWRFAPASEREKAAKAIAAEQERRASVALYRLGRLLLDETPLIADVVETVKRAPTPEQAWAKRAGSSGLSAEAYLQLYTLDEMRTQRITAQLRQSLPSQWLDLYNRALQDPSEQGNATTAKIVEQLLSADSWQGQPLDSLQLRSEATVMLALKRRMDEAREARVSEELREVQAVIAEAKRYERRVEQVHGVIPVNPDRVPPSDKKLPLHELVGHSAESTK